MRAVQIDSHGGPEVLQLREVKDAIALPRHVLVRTVASSINPVDWKTRAWDRGSGFPMTLGWDLAGVVVESDDTLFAPGDRVVAMSAQGITGVGAWAELVSLPASLVAHAPIRIGLAQAAALPLAAMTAHIALSGLGVLAGRRLLVTGAAGGVGSVMLQLARAQGATVDALVSRPAHEAGALDLGAERAFHRLDALPASAYDAVFDTASVDPGPALVSGGRYASITDDPLPAIPGAESPEVYEDGAVLREMVGLVDAGSLTVRVAEYHAIADVRTAHERFEAGGLGGKLVLLF
jgi:NADPH:quinone reductase-like Zn-dependent oxidoreductase